MISPAAALAMNVGYIKTPAKATAIEALVLNLLAAENATKNGKKWNVASAIAFKTI